ncbi:hypothetical protein H1S01_10710 [Heliobacterium chlorum]|uniref:Uncharacterized protein n=1 Tax=Heliobacterium chlorum TaxID=2698 RepID=A0ABR7T2I1_HELCL|nr:hypothetical protein [Heliobacterium chlorum]MBC9784979.1 hypothetical protein [Heliobacterium chlorum]
MKRFFLLLFIMSIVSLIIYKATEPPVTITFGSFAHYYSDETATQKAYSVVIGRVKKVLGTNNNGYPKTEILVEVEKNFKGDLNSEFIFLQDGGLDEETGSIVQIGDYKILAPGNRYLFFLNKADAEPGKYWSIGGPQTVYLVSGDIAKNAFSSTRDKSISELEEIINLSLTKGYH